MTEEEAAQKMEEESSKFASEFIEYLSVDGDVAEVLVEEGFTTLKKLPMCQWKNCWLLKKFDEEIVNELRNRYGCATDQAIASEEALVTRSLQTICWKCARCRAN